MRRLSRKYNSFRIMKRTVRREREKMEEKERERFGERLDGLGMKVSTGHVPCGNLGAS
jgi:hypothetical protein